MAPEGMAHLRSLIEKYTTRHRQLARDDEQLMELSEQINETGLSVYIAFHILAASVESEHISNPEMTKENKPVRTRKKAKTFEQDLTHHDARFLQSLKIAFD